MTIKLSQFVADNDPKVRSTVDAALACADGQITVRPHRPDLELQPGDVVQFGDWHAVVPGSATAEPPARDAGVADELPGSAENLRALRRLLRGWACCGYPNVCGVSCRDSEQDWALAQAARAVDFLLASETTESKPPVEAVTEAPDGWDEKTQSPVDEQVESLREADPPPEFDDPPWWVCTRCGFDAKAFEPRPEKVAGAARWHAAMPHLEGSATDRGDRGWRAMSADAESGRSAD